MKMSEQNVAGSWDGKSNPSEAQSAEGSSAGALGGMGWIFMLAGLAACAWALAAPSSAGSGSVVNVGLLSAKGLWATLGGAFTVTGAVMLSGQAVVRAIRDQ
jgi:hypothetical protein